MRQIFDRCWASDAKGAASATHDKVARSRIRRFGAAGYRRDRLDRRLIIAEASSVTYPCAAGVLPLKPHRSRIKHSGHFGFRATQV